MLQYSLIPCNIQNGGADEQKRIQTWAPFFRGENNNVISREDEATNNSCSQHLGDIGGEEEGGRKFGYARETKNVRVKEHG